jgi:hypothetical protein
VIRTHRLAGRELVERGTDPLGAERLAEAPHATPKAGRIIRVELQVRAIERDAAVVGLGHALPSLVASALISRWRGGVQRGSR